MVPPLPTPPDRDVDWQAILTFLEIVIVVSTLMWRFG